MPEQIIEQKNSPTEDVKTQTLAQEISQQNHEKPFLAVYVKTLVFLIFALGIVVGNFFLEGKMANGKQTVEQKISSFDYEKENFVDKNLIFRFTNAEVEPEMAFVKSDNGTHVFNLKKGDLWFNSALSSDKVNILVDKVLIIPRFAQFDLKVIDNRLELSVANGDVYLGFLPDGAEVKDYLDEYSPIFINRLLVSKDNQVSIPLNKVNEKIAPLLTSKLIKEFKYGFLPDSFYEKPWIQENLNKDSFFKEKMKQDFISGVLKRGVSSGGDFLSSVAYWTEENLVFVPTKKEKAVFDHVFQSLNDAIYYSVQKNDQKLGESLSEFSVNISLLDPKVRQSEDYQKVIESYINKLFIFSEGDSQYKVYQNLIEEKFANDKFFVIPFLWSDIYEAIDKGDLEAEESMRRFYTYFDKTFSSVDNRDYYVNYMTFYNQLFDNLFLHYPVFYKEEYFAIKNALEKNLLSQYDGQLKNELSQYFINNKIRFMKLLKKFFFEEVFEVKDARSIFSRLFSEIDEIMPKEDAKLAVLDLFKSQLSDIEDFWGYLSSPEYHSISYGVDNKSRYEVYLSEREKLWSLENIQEEILGKSPEKEIDVLDIIKQVEDFFKASSDIGSVQVEEIKDIEQRYVNVNGVLGGFPFKGVFDRATESLSEVYVYDQLISERPVKLNSLLSLLRSKFSDLKPDETAKENEMTLESDAQRTARFYVSKKVKEYGFEAELEDIAVVDEKNAVYRVKEVKIKDLSDVGITFDIFMNNQEAVSNVFLNVDGNPRVLTETYTLEELKDIAVAERDFVIDGTINGASDDTANSSANDSKSGSILR